MDDTKISSESTTLVTTESDPGEPQAWWHAPINDKPWWHDTPLLNQPLQQQAWYLPAVQAPALEYLDTSPRITFGPVATTAVVLGVIAAVAALADW